MISVLAGAAMAALAQAPTIGWEKAADHVGQLCAVEGPVVLVRQSRELCSLHFSKDTKSDFTVIIYATNASRWPDKIETLYAAKKVCVTGVVRRIAGRPEMVISDPSQITVLGDAAEALATVADKAAAAAKTATAATAATATTTNIVEAPAPEPLPLLPPFTCDVKRFTGARRGAGVGDSGGGVAFRQRIYLELVLQNTTTQTVTDIEWQWVVLVMSVGSATDQYVQGTESQIELKPFEAKTLRSDEIKMAGVTTFRLGQTSGTKFRGYYVRVHYKGHCVFKEGSSPEITQDIESYLDKLERQKRSAKKG